MPCGLIRTNTVFQANVYMYCSLDLIYQQGSPLVSVHRVGYTGNMKIKHSLFKEKNTGRLKLFYMVTIAIPSVF